MLEETIQVFPRPEGLGAAFQLRGWDDLKGRELERRLSAAAPDQGEQIGVSPIFRLKTMNPQQKARVAMSGSRSERAILLRDHNGEGGWSHHVVVAFRASGLRVEVGKGVRIHRVRKIANLHASHLIRLVRAVRTALGVGIHWHASTLPKPARRCG